MNTCIADSSIKIVNKITPEQGHQPNNSSDTWITNRVKNAINRRDKVFQSGWAIQQLRIIICIRSNALMFTAIIRTRQNFAHVVSLCNVRLAAHI